MQTPARPRRLARALALGAAAAACSPAPSISVDLTELLPFAEIGRETRFVDFGTAAARDHLVSGWGGNHASRTGVTTVRGKNEQAVLRFFVGEPRDLELRFRCWTSGALEGEPPRVALAVNGQPVGETAIGAAAHWYGLRVPAALLVFGENRLSVDVPVEPRAVVWDALRIGDPRGGGEPTTRRDAEGAPVLRLPFHSEVAYAVMLPEGGWLSFDAIAAFGDAGAARLEVEVRRAGEAQARTASFTQAGALELEPAGERPVRVALRARSAGRAPADAGLDVRAPTLHTQSPPAPPGPAARAPAARPPNVLVYLIDTLRSDRLGAYGHARDTSPHIDAFAREAALFLDASAHAPWTRPSTLSILTGLLPTQHGVVRPQHALPEGVVLLSDLLRGAGYATLGVVTNGNVAADWGFAQGFDEYRYLPEGHPTETHRLSDEVNEVAFEWLEEARAKPFFLFVHTTDPHSPYAPRAPYREKLAAGVDPVLGSAAQIREAELGQLAGPGVPAALGELYDAEIAFNDEQFGALLAKLDELGLAASTIVVLLSDHGEAFAEHGSFQHGNTLFEELLRIPLVIRFPDGRGRGRRVAEPVGQVDVVPTLLDALGLAAPGWLQGRSLLPLLEAPAGGIAPAQYGHLARSKGEWESVAQGGYKLIRTTAAGDGSVRVRLYDLAADPGERHDLAGERPVWRAYLLSQLERLRRLPRPVGEAGVPEIDPALRERLEALGYL